MLSGQITWKYASEHIHIQHWDNSCNQYQIYCKHKHSECQPEFWSMCSICIMRSHICLHHAWEQWKFFIIVIMHFLKYLKLRVHFLFILYIYITIVSLFHRVQRYIYQRYYFKTKTKETKTNPFISERLGKESWLNKLKIRILHPRAQTFLLFHSWWQNWCFRLTQKCDDLGSRLVTECNFLQPSSKIQCSR